FSVLVDAETNLSSAGRISSQLLAVRFAPLMRGYCWRVSFVALAMAIVAAGQFIVKSALCEFQPPRALGCAHARVGSQVNDPSVDCGTSGTPWCAHVSCSAW